VSFIEIVEPCSLDEADSYSIEAGPTGMEILADEPTARSRSATSATARRRRSGALDAGLHRGVRLPPRLADQRRARGRQGRKDRALGASEKALRLARRANARTKAARATRQRRGRPRAAWRRPAGAGHLMKVRTPIYAFNGGEISRRMEGRSDLDGIYDRAFATMLNYVATVEGPATKRPGFRYIKEAALTSTWLSRFVFNTTQAYVLEWADKKRALLHQRRPHRRRRRTLRARRSVQRRPRRRGSRASRASIGSTSRTQVTRRG
jgi:hypothetical protein